MEEIKIEFDPNSLSPLDFLRKIDGILREMVICKHLSAYAISIPSVNDSEILQTWKTISAEAETKIEDEEGDL